MNLHGRVTLILVASDTRRSRTVSFPGSWARLAGPGVLCLLAMMLLSGMWAGWQLRTSARAAMAGLARDSLEQSIDSRVLARGAWQRLKPWLGVGGAKAPIEGYRLPALVPSRASEDRVLKLHAVHLDERLEVVPFDDEGRVRRFAFARIADFFRCRHTGKQVPIDPQLIRLLLKLSNHFEGKRILLVSGHRAAGVLDTNPTSRHVAGQAADVRIAGVGLRRLRQAALDLGAGGVGFYPHDYFVHVDVREQEYVWEQGGQAGEEVAAAPGSEGEHGSRGPDGERRPGTEHGPDTEHGPNTEG